MTTPRPITPQEVDAAIRRMQSRTAGSNIARIDYSYAGEAPRKGSWGVSERSRDRQSPVVVGAYMLKRRFRIAVTTQTEDGAPDRTMRSTKDFSRDEIVCVDSFVMQPPGAPKRHLDPSKLLNDLERATLSKTALERRGLAIFNREKTHYNLLLEAPYKISIDEFAEHLVKPYLQRFVDVGGSPLVAIHEWRGPTELSEDIRNRLDPIAGAANIDVLCENPAMRATLNRLRNKFGAVDVIFEDEPPTKATSNLPHVVIAKGKAFVYGMHAHVLLPARVVENDAMSDEERAKCRHGFGSITPIGEIIDVAYTRSGAVTAVKKFNSVDIWRSLQEALFERLRNVTGRDLAVAPKLLTASPDIGALHHASDIELIHRALLKAAQDRAAAKGANTDDLDRFIPSFEVGTLKKPSKDQLAFLEEVVGAYGELGGVMKNEEIDREGLLGRVAAYATFYQWTNGRAFRQLDAGDAAKRIESLGTILSLDELIFLLHLNYPPAPANSAEEAARLKRIAADVTAISKKLAEIKIFRPERPVERLLTGADTSRKLDGLIGYVLRKFKITGIADAPRTAPWAGLEKKAALEKLDVDTLPDDPDLLIITDDYDPRWKRAKVMSPLLFMSAYSKTPGEFDRFQRIAIPKPSALNTDVIKAVAVVTRHDMTLHLGVEETTQRRAGAIIAALANGARLLSTPAKLAAKMEASDRQTELAERAAVSTQRPETMPPVASNASVWEGAHRALLQDEGLMAEAMTLLQRGRLLVRERSLTKLLKANNIERPEEIAKRAMKKLEQVEVEGVKMYGTPKTIEAFAATQSVYDEINQRIREEAKKALSGSSAPRTQVIAGFTDALYKVSDIVIAADGQDERHGKMSPRGFISALAKNPNFFRGRRCIIERPTLFSPSDLQAVMTRMVDHGLPEIYVDARKTGAFVNADRAAISALPTEVQRELKAEQSPAAHAKTELQPARYSLEWFRDVISRSPLLAFATAGSDHDKEIADFAAEHLRGASPDINRDRALYHKALHLETDIKTYGRLQTGEDPGASAEERNMAMQALAETPVALLSEELKTRTKKPHILDNVAERELSAFGKAVIGAYTGKLNLVTDGSKTIPGSMILPERRTKADEDAFSASLREMNNRTLFYHAGATRDAADLTPNDRLRARHAAAYKLIEENARARGLNLGTGKQNFMRATDLDLAQRHRDDASIPTIGLTVDKDPEQRERTLDPNS